jgi:hypothetical protein
LLTFFTSIFWLLLLLHPVDRTVHSVLLSFYVIHFPFLIVYLSSH